MPDPGHSGFAVAGIFPQKGPVISYPQRRSIATAEIGSQAAQYKWEANAKGSVGQIARRVGKAPIVTAWRAAEQCL
jgi:hypothetical protein